MDGTRIGRLIPWIVLPPIVLPATWWTLREFDAFVERYPPIWGLASSLSVPVVMVLWLWRDHVRAETVKRTLEITALIAVLVCVVYPFVRYGL